MSGITFSGLASGMDTASLVDRLIALDKRPITSLNNQKLLAQNQQTAYRALNTKLQTLQSKAFNLTQLGTILARHAFSSDQAKATASASADTPLGNYQLEVVSLASATKLTGHGPTGGGIGSPLTVADGSSTLADLNDANRVANEITGGTFTINGATVVIETSDTLDDVFARINSVTGGTVTARIGDAGTDGPQYANKIILSHSGGGTITVGSAGDTSNFLKALKLDNALQGTDPQNAGNSALVSTGQLGVSQRTKPLDSANLAAPVGTGWVFAINGVNFDYDVTKDSLKDILDRINASAAGVTASYDTLKDQVVLQARETGASSIVLDDKGGSLLQALGLTNGTTTAGANAVYKINGQTFSASSNSVSDAGGLQGLSLNLKATTTDPITLDLQVDAGKVQSAVKEFIDAYNAFADDIEKYTVTNDPKNRPLLSGDMTAETIRGRILSVLNSAVGLNGSTSKGILGELGITSGAPGSDSFSIGGQKGLRYEFDAHKLTALLNGNPNRVAEIMGASNDNGIFAKLNTYLRGINSVTGTFATADQAATDRIKTIDDRIGTLNQRLETKRKRLNAQFLAMEKAMLAAQRQQSALSGLIMQLNANQQQ